MITNKHKAGSVTGSLEISSTKEMLTFQFSLSQVLRMRAILAQSQVADSGPLQSLLGLISTVLGALSPGFQVPARMTR